MARISEIHFSNAHASATGIREFFEIALSPGEDPADFFVSTYNQDGAVRVDLPLTDPGIVTSVDAGTGETIYVINGSTYGFVLTNPDGGNDNNNEAVALTDVSGPTNVVVNFYDIGGGTTNITAANGAAAGATSTNIAGDYSSSIQFNQPDPTVQTFATASPGTAAVVCFVQGTPILTPNGHVPIEDLRVGDLVHTLDNGAQPICWIGARTVPGTGRFAPIRLSRGTFHAQSDIFVSPAHRVHLSAPRAQLMFDHNEVLVPAHLLTALPGIQRRPCARVTYWHLMFDRHQMVFADGLISESFFPGAEAVSSLAMHSRDELFALFPELARGAARYGAPARTVLRGYEARALVGCAA